MNGKRYRYGFNGKEKDNETYGEGNAYDFGARIYDSRLGRWLSLDPLMEKYPSFSPYNFAGCSPITFYDADGRIIMVNYTDANGTSKSFQYTPGIAPTDKDAIKDKCVMRLHEAITYNMNTEKGKEVWSALNSSEGVLYINFIENSTSTAPQDKFIGEPTKKTDDGKRIIGTINWDPFSSIMVDDNGYAGNGISIKGSYAPSTNLIHEAGHAMKYNKCQIDKTILQFNDDNLDGSDERYGSKEERRNTEEVEHVYLRQINAWEKLNSKTPSYQPLRFNHWASVHKRDLKAGVNKVDMDVWNRYKIKFEEKCGKSDDPDCNQ
ncbi:MAG: RHS repeat-associated core domain-containing protein [Bacteroidota bacterium]|nr:RHS repeat-associated core domain-containing protein [Bacteroidota bacterium]